MIFNISRRANSREPELPLEAAAPRSGTRLVPRTYDLAEGDNTHTIAQEEIFGPVLTIIPYGDVDEAVQIANHSEHGLGGTVWTRDLERGLEVARRVETGTIGVN